MKNIDEIVAKLERSNIFKMEKEPVFYCCQDAEYGITFNKELAYNFINSILCRNTGLKKSFKKSISAQLNKASLKDKEWLLKKLQKQINYQK